MILTKGKGGGDQAAVVTGIARIALSGREALERVKDGDILVTRMTDVDYVPAMELAAAVITDKGGIICHAAIICSELKTPFIVGTKDGTQTITDGALITLSVATGEVCNATTD